MWLTCELVIVKEEEEKKLVFNVQPAMTVISLWNNWYKVSSWYDMVVDWWPWNDRVRSAVSMMWVWTGDMKSPVYDQQIFHDVVVAGGH